MPCVIKEGDVRLIVFLTLIFVLTFTLALYNVITAFVTVPSSKSASVLKTDKSGLKERITEKLQPLVRLCAKFIKIDKYKRDEITSNLIRIGRDKQTPEEFYAEAVIYGLGITLFAIPVHLFIGQSFLTIGVAVIGIVIIFNKISELSVEVQKINDEIKKELPKFVRTYTHSYNKNAQIIDIFTEYRKIAQPAFAKDIDILITDLKTGNEEDSLIRFADRINIPELSTFILGIIGTSKGDDQKTFFMFMSEKMTALAYENLRKETIKRPAKIKRATFILMITLFAIFLYPLIINLIDGISGML